MRQGSQDPVSSRNIEGFSKLIHSPQNLIRFFKRDPEKKLNGQDGVKSTDAKRKKPRMGLLVFHSIRKLSLSVC